MEHFKSGFVGLVGRPNVGKSTLMNRIIGQKIAITSNKPQTTRNRIQTVYHDNRGQIIFQDTPGIHRAKNRLGEYMVGVAKRTFEDVDVIVWLIEPDEKVGSGDQRIAEALSKNPTPVILVINKIDTKPKEELLKTIDAYSKKMEFSEILPLSAKTGEGVRELIDVLYSYLPEGPKFYEEDTVTDQPVRQIVAELIREKTLRLLSEEVPHGIAVSVDQMKFNPGKKGLYQIDATIVCEKDSHKGIIIGKQGHMLKRIGMEARKEMEQMLECKVNLNLWVKVKKDWRDSDFLLKNFGFHNDTDMR